MYGAIQSKVTKMYRNKKARERKQEVVVAFLFLSFSSRQLDHHRGRQTRCAVSGWFSCWRRDEGTPRWEMRSTIARQCSIPVENATGNSRDESGLSPSFSLSLFPFLFLLVSAMQIVENARRRKSRKSPRMQRAQTKPHRLDQTRANAKYLGICFETVDITWQPQEVAPLMQNYFVIAS